MITEDKFATGNPGLINNKPYYFMALAYAYNEYIPYAPEVAFTPSSPYTASNAGQKKPYLAGRKNIRTYTAIPHKIEASGNLANSVYGTRPSIIGLAGSGNGGFTLSITDECKQEIVENYSVDHIEYKQDQGPIDISVIDPLSVPNAEFIFEIGLPIVAFLISFTKSSRGS